MLVGVAEPLQMAACSEGDHLALGRPEFGCQPCHTVFCLILPSAGRDAISLSFCVLDDGFPWRRLISFCMVPG